MPAAPVGLRPTVGPPQSHDHRPSDSGSLHHTCCDAHSWCDAVGSLPITVDVIANEADSDLPGARIARPAGLSVTRVDPSRGAHRTSTVARIVQSVTMHCSDLFDREGAAREAPPPRQCADPCRHRAYLRGRPRNASARLTHYRRRRRLSRADARRSAGRLAPRQAAHRRARQTHDRVCGDHAPGRDPGCFIASPRGQAVAAPGSNRDPDIRPRPVRLRPCLPRPPHLHPSRPPLRPRLRHHRRTPFHRPPARPPAPRPRQRRHRLRTDPLRAAWRPRSSKWQRRIVRSPGDHPRIRRPIKKPLFPVPRESGLEHEAGARRRECNHPDSVSRGRYASRIGATRSKKSEGRRDGRPCHIRPEHWLAFWSGGRDSNPRQPAWEAGTLPTELPPRGAEAVYAAAYPRSTASAIPQCFD